MTARGVPQNSGGDSKQDSKTCWSSRARRMQVLYSGRLHKGPCS
eukprot:CAMPEP_0177212272 /NCGR_PEP_ID=MMETSP0367-20130122/32546_1 /TAXON_ID=447022 ORGANISM="Scrippsiella hangoei-like, Strain SHHI-4" /NCGR_SAMPLE_ID=MMETSP0367 /ASSEMBLY_ACC=CAM_ASM_000362 /LENGTH=43 /DNA_ID= /DNA_START= /DNA_END= /DNA_ORIENTATION=